MKNFLITVFVVFALTGCSGNPISPFETPYTEEELVVIESQQGKIGTAKTRLTAASKVIN